MAPLDENTEREPSTDVLPSGLQIKYVVNVSNKIFEEQILTNGNPYKPAPIVC